CAITGLCVRRRAGECFYRRRGRGCCRNLPGRLRRRDSFCRFSRGCIWLRRVSSFMRRWRKARVRGRRSGGGNLCRDLLLSCLLHKRGSVFKKRMSKKLEELRKKIDALDQVIHDALMARADLIDSVAAEKRKHNLPYVQPAREAQMIRRLLARHRGPLPAAAVVRIWRELVGAVSLLQTGLKISVCV